jgi:hypothetical protein
LVWAVMVHSWHLLERWSCLFLVPSFGLLLLVIRIIILGHFTWYSSRLIHTIHHLFLSMLSLSCRFPVTSINRRLRHVQLPYLLRYVIIIRLIPLRII